MSGAGTGDVFGAASDVSSPVSTPGSVHGSAQVTVVTELLLSGFGSGLLPLTVAVFVRVAGVAGARARIVTDTRPPRPRLPSLQVTVDVPEHFPWLVLADTNVAWLGSLSPSWAALRGRGPCGASR